MKKLSSAANYFRQYYYVILNMIISPYLLKIFNNYIHLRQILCGNRIWNKGKWLANSFDFSKTRLFPQFNGCLCELLPLLQEVCFLLVKQFLLLQETLLFLYKLGIIQKYLPWVLMFVCLNGILQNEEKLKMPKHLINIKIIGYPSYI